MSTAPDSSIGQKSQRVYKRSPRAMGTEVCCARRASSTGWSERRGSSMNMGWSGSRAAADCFAIGRWTRSWKSIPTSIPNDFTILTRSIVASNEAGESSPLRSSEKSIGSLQNNLLRSFWQLKISVPVVLLQLFQRLQVYRRQSTRKPWSFHEPCHQANPR